MKWLNRIKDYSSNYHVKNVLIIIASVMVLSLLVFHRYFFGGYYLLHSDLLRANLPVYYHMYDNFFLHEGGFWSWRMGIGTSMFSHGDSYFDPFVYIVFLRGREGIPSMMIWVLVIKLVFEAIAFYFYIDYFKLDKHAEIIGAVLYAFSGYSLVAGNNFALGTVLVYLPLIFLGTEKWIKEKRTGLLIVSLFLMGIYNFYYFYISGILTFVYLMFRIVQTGRGKEWLRYTIRLIAIGCISTLLAAPSILPLLELMKQSSRTLSGADYKMSWILFIPNIGTTFTALIRSLDLNIICGGSLGYLGKTYLNHDSLDTATYVSAFFFIFLFQWLYYDKKNRKAILWAIALMLVGLSTPAVSFVMNAFSTINMRWLCVMSVLGAVAVSQGVDQVIKHHEVHVRTFFSSLLAMVLSYLVGVYVLIFDRDVLYSDTLIELITCGHFYYLMLFLVILGMVILVRLQSVLPSKVVVITILLLMTINVYSNHSYLYDSNRCCFEYTEDNGACYMDSSADIIADIRSRDANFYRMNKDFDSVTCYVPEESRNDAMAQGYYGLKNYNSLNNGSYQEFLFKTSVYSEDVSGQSLNYINGVGDRYNLMSYLGVKYYMTKNPEPELPNSFELYQSGETIDTYLNKNAYPLAFVNYEKMPLSQFEELDTEYKDIALLSYTIVDEDVPPIDVSEFNDVNMEQLAEKKQEQFSLVDFWSDDVVFDIYVDEDDSLLSLSMPYDKGWQVYIDGKKSEILKINTALLGTKIDAGKHQVELKYIPRAFYLGIACMLITLFAIVMYYSIKERKKTTR